MIGVARTRWGVVWLAVGAGMIAASHVGKVSLGLPMVQRDLGLGMVGGGFVVSVFMATGVALGLIAGSIADRLGQMRVLYVGLALLLIACCWGSLVRSGGAWLPTFLITERGLGVGLAGLLTAFVLIFNGCGNLTSGALVSRGWNRWSICAINGAGMALAEIGMLIPASPDAVKYVCAVVFAYLGGLLPTAVLSGAPLFAPTPRQIGTTNGLLVVGASLGMLIGPPLLGGAVEGSSTWSGALAPMLACAAVVFALALVMRPVEGRAVTSAAG